MKLYSVGAGSVGQLGHADTKDHNKPLMLEVGNMKWKKLSCGNYHNLALSAQGQLFTWGAGWNGQLGLGKTVQKQFIPRLVTVLENEVSVSRIACGATHCVVLTSEGEVLTWGGETGDFGLHRVGMLPKDVTIKKIAAGASFTMAISGDGQVFAWGSGVDGRLGVGNLKNFRNPQKVIFETNVRVIRIALGKAHSLAVSDQGHVYSWGCGNKGQLGLGDDTSRMSPAQVPNLSNIKYVRAGEAHSVALSDKGLVFTWGDGEHGQLGLGNSKQELSPCHVSGLPDDVMIARIGSGQWHTMAITIFGDIFMWGNNAFSQLGLGHTDEINLPEFIDTMPEKKYVISAMGGEKHTVFLIADINLLESKMKKPPKSITPPTSKSPALSANKPPSPSLSPRLSPRLSPASSPAIRQAKRRSWRMSAEFADIMGDLEKFEGEANEKEKEKEVEVEVEVEKERGGEGYQEKGYQEKEYQENEYDGGAIVSDDRNKNQEGGETVHSEDKELLPGKAKKEEKSSCCIIL